MTDEQINERFDQLWASLREQVMAARGEGREQGIYTMGEGVMGQRYGSHIAIGGLDGDDNGRGYAYVHNSVKGASIVTSAYGSELVTIAAHCLAAAMEIEDDEKNRKP